MTALSALARFIATDPLEADATTQRIVADGVVDAFGCILAGSSQPVARAAQSAIQAIGATGSAAVYGTNITTSRSHAAFLNTVAGHALDFDDWEVPGNTHPTVVLLPALLACADTQTSGADLARAYIAGFEVIARLGEVLNFEHYDLGWHSTATLGAIGAVGAVARLLGLDAEKTTHGLSIAVSRAVGYTCQFGSDTKPMQAGFAAQGGVEAAYLAQTGLTGQADVLEHARGMNALMAGVDPNRLKAMCDRLGDGLAISTHRLVIKPWPSCGYTHRIMTAALDMDSEIEDVQQIEHIELHLPDFHAAVLPFLKPIRREEALFSAPFVAAMGLRHQRLNLCDIQSGVWNEPVFQRLMARTSLHPFTPKRPDLNYDPDQPDRVNVRLSSGVVLGRCCAYPIGAPQNPMNKADLRAKFAANAPGVEATQLRALFDWQDQRNITDAFYTPETTS